APVVLHGARLGGVRLDVLGSAGLLVHEDDGDAAPAELVGEHQAERAAAGDENRGLGWKKNGGVHGGILVPPRREGPSDRNADPGALSGRARRSGIPPDGQTIVVPPCDAEVAAACAAYPMARR